MNRLNRIFIGLIASFFFYSCEYKNDTVDSQVLYNKKANELILQELQNFDCDCLIEIPEESMIQVIEAERPGYDIRSKVIKKMGLKDNAGLDSLLNMGLNFKLDTEAFKKNNVQIVTFKDIIAMKKNNDYKLLKMCPKGILSIRKPIFDKTYRKAVVDRGFALSCIGMPIAIYQYRNNKWVHAEN